ncbi:MAG: ATP-binding protein [Rhizobiaceae bacterium]
MGKLRLPNSLTMRAIALSTFWAALSLFVIANVINTLYRNAAEKSYANILSAQLFSLIAAADIDKTGKLNGAPELGDIRYQQPASGWYWSVEPVTSKVTGQLKSVSLGGGAIKTAELKDVPFTTDFRRSYMAEGLDGETVDVFETEVSLGTEDQIARFRVMGNRNEFEAELADFSQTLYLYLTLFGLGSIIVNALAILAGLRPLKRAAEALADVREGKAQRLDGAFPAEIEPLAAEMNALIDNNRRIVERSRTQVGNLAHSLKTPLSVIINEGQSLGGKTGKLVGEQAQSMQTQIQHYLQRARVAAQRDSVVFRAPVAPIVERMLRVMRKLNPDKSFERVGSAASLIFAGEAEDFEEVLGNLLENAAKWGKSRVEVSLSAEGPVLTLTVADDGPGLDESEMGEALKRGKRLDETMPGTGLGLAIVSDTVREYGGTVTLGRSKRGGLEVKLSLPRAI